MAEDPGPGTTPSETEARSGSSGEGRAEDVRAALEALSDEEREVLAKVTEIIRRIRYGTVVLVIQDGKVVQIEMAEKFRLR
jgi:hypothetical protein